MSKLKDFQLGGYVKLLNDYGGHKAGTISKIRNRIHADGREDSSFIEGYYISLELIWLSNGKETCNPNYKELEWLGMTDPRVPQINNNYAIY